MHASMFILVVGLASSPVEAGLDDSEGWMFTGQTQAAANDVRARATGHLTRVAVREGDAVKQGDLLAEIDPRAYQLDLQAANARQKGAEARMQMAEIKLGNAERLKRDKVVSQDELALALAAKAEAEAALSAAKVEVDRTALILSWTRVTAPISGRVSRIQSTEGSLVAADQTRILRVVAADPLYVRFDVPEAIVLKLRRNGLCEPSRLDIAVGFATDAGYAHTAHLELIEPEVDPGSGLVRFRAAISNPQGLLSPGMSARIRLTPHPK